MLITLCGSTRFVQEGLWHEWDKKLTYAGHSVITIHEVTSGEAAMNPPSQEAKDFLDLVHLDKIRRSDAIVVLNKGGYWGYSTNREITWARILEKRIYFIEPDSIHEDARTLLRLPSIHTQCRERPNVT